MPHRTSPAPESFTLRVPDGDDRERHVCDRCGFVNYVNPKIVAGSVAVRGDHILLCRRAIPPRKGFWTLPAGFMEEGESVADAAAREAREEACADIAVGALLGVYSIPRLSQVQIFFRAELRGDVAPGPESEDVRLATWDEIPWDAIAFPSVVWALEDWRATRGQDAFAPSLRVAPDTLRPPSE